MIEGRKLFALKYSSSHRGNKIFLFGCLGFFLVSICKYLKSLCPEKNHYLPLNNKNALATEVNKRAAKNLPKDFLCRHAIASKYVLVYSKHSFLTRTCM